MNPRNALKSLAARFDRLGLRERLLVTAAVLLVLVAVFNTLVLSRLDARKSELSGRIAAIEAQVSADSVAADGSGGAQDLPRASALAKTLAIATAQLDSESAGLIAPQRMIGMIHDVLSRQSGVALVSLRSLPTYPLLGLPRGGPAEADSCGLMSGAVATTSPAGTEVTGEGPYVHSVELVLQGRYLDVLTYLQTLEKLPWHFYWQGLELDAARAPSSRACVTLGTVSMTRDWIDL